MSSSPRLFSCLYSFLPKCCLTRQASRSWRMLPRVPYLPRRSAEVDEGFDFVAADGLMAPAAARIVRRGV